MRPAARLVAGPRRVASSTGFELRVTPASRAVVYDAYIMKRTQIYLTAAQGRLLERRSRATGRTVSELIRAAIDEVYARRTMDREAQIRLARHSAGAWKDRPETGAEYVERLRGSRRLGRVHGVE